MNLFEYNEKVAESFQTLLKTNSIFSMIINFFLNVLWSLKNLIKKLLGKQVNVSKSEVNNNENNKVSLKTIYQYSKLFSKNNDYVIVIDLKTDINENSGAADYGNTLLKKAANDNKQGLYICYERNTTNWFLKAFNCDAEELSLNNISDVEEIFKNSKVSELIINNLVFYKEPEEFINFIIKLKDNYSFNLHYYFHDFLSVCPSFFLITKQGKPCVIESDKKCNKCLLKNQNRSVIRNEIANWRESFNSLFEKCDTVTFFSDFTKDIVISIYPVLANKYSIEYHELLMSENHSNYIRPEKGEVIRIGFVGSFNYVKGSDYFIELINKLKANKYNVEPIIVGYIPENTYKELDYKVTGRYNRDDLGKILTDNKIDFVVYPSFCESFSYVAQELMALNVPIVLFKRGAPSERIIKQKYEPSEIADLVTTDSLYDATVKMINKLK